MPSPVSKGVAFLTVTRCLSTPRADLRLDASLSRSNAECPRAKANIGEIRRQELGIFARLKLRLKRALQGIGPRAASALFSRMTRISPNAIAHYRPELRDTRSRTRANKVMDVRTDLAYMHIYADQRSGIWYYARALGPYRLPRITRVPRPAAITCAA